MARVGPDDLAVVRLDGSVAEGDLGGMSTEVVAMHAQVEHVPAGRTVSVP
jgi:hypothetical protein